jgi:hypothetical protein
MLRVRFTHILETDYLNEIGDTRQPRPYVRRQGFDLGAHRFIERLNRPCHLRIYPKRYTSARITLRTVEGDL